MAEPEWIATRALISPGQNAELKVARPEQVNPDEWRCAFSVAGTVAYAYGLDAFQSLLNAIAGTRASLDGRTEKFTWIGGSYTDHGVVRFVPSWFGVDFARRLEQMIDDEIERYTRQFTKYE